MGDSGLGRLVFPSADEVTAAGPPSPTAFLRESVAAVGTRFHLVGLFALTSLLVRIASHWMGEDDTWFPLVASAIVVYIACSAGVLGTLFQAATATRESASFFHWALHLLLPITWLWLRIYLIVFGPTDIAVGFYLAHKGVATPSDSIVRLLFWCAPFQELIALVLALYSFPLCILWRTRGEWGPHLRAGVKFLRARAPESRPLLFLLVVVAALEAVQEWTLGPEGYKAVPGYLEGLLELAGSYLVLVVFFGATRIVLDSLEAGPRAAPAGAGTAAPGPST